MVHLASLFSHGGENILSLICQGFIQLVWREHSQIFSQFNWFWSFLWMELWVEIFSIHSFWNICEWKFFLFIVFWDSYSQVLWNSDWMQVQSMGDLAVLSFSINKKRFAIFRQSSNFAVGQIRTRIAESADQWLTHYTIWAVDEDVTYLGLFITSISSYVPI